MAGTQAWSHAMETSCKTHASSCSGPTPLHVQTCLIIGPLLACSQEYVVKLPDRIRRLAERAQGKWVAGFRVFLECQGHSGCVPTLLHVQAYTTEADRQRITYPDESLMIAAAARKKKGQTANFSWVFNREVVLH
jgi:hypothetical protein